MSRQSLLLVFSWVAVANLPSSRGNAGRRPGNGVGWGDSDVIVFLARSLAGSPVHVFRKLPEARLTHFWTQKAKPI